MIALPMNPYTLGGVAESQINVKMPAALKARLVAMEKATRIPKTELLRALGEAACDFYEENGYFGFPHSTFGRKPDAPKKNSSMPTQSSSGRSTKRTRSGLAGQ